MRLLAVDWGAKRIGIAVGESETAVATPRKNIVASGKLESDARAIADLATKEGAEAVLVGVPFNPLHTRAGEALSGSGSESEEKAVREARRMERLCRTLGEHLKALGLAVLLQDETLTSVEADNLLFESGYKASERDRMRDGAAAARLLYRHFEALRPAGCHATGEGDAVA